MGAGQRGVHLRLPLVLTNATKTMSTNTDGSVTGRAPVNQINHAKKLADASFRTVVTPNVDTLYSQAWLDVGAEPMVYILPETDRFCNVQLLDAWTNTAAVLDQAGAYVIALPSWTGELPENVTRVDVPTETVWSITRVVLSGNEDLPNVYAIQDQMRLIPLSAYLAGGDYVADGHICQGKRLCSREQGALHAACGVLPTRPTR